MDSMMCTDNHERGPAAAVAEQEPSFRVEKVLDIKRQLAEGRYDIAEKLDVVVDRLLEDLL
ncbi:MAG: flagellar biosynthesis anti-sigma factor FlgM [Planctomycetaceae bacterium]|nr:MAG: flagellar biosynthesis anti-sigma factor FlgM [Planctomycetaceae bacterium]